MKYTALVLSFFLIPFVSASVHPRDVDPQGRYTLTLESDPTKGMGILYEEFAIKEAVDHLLTEFQFPHGIPSHSWGKDSLDTSGSIQPTHSCHGRVYAELGGTKKKMGHKVMPKDVTVHRLPGDGEGVKLRVANKLWLDNKAV